MPAIRIKNGPQKGSVFEIHDVGLVIGRAEEADIRLFDRKVEDYHARVYRMGEMYFIRNLAEDGFTYVNDEPVTEELLREGDVIRVGSTLLAFDSSRATIRAVEESDYLLEDFVPEADDSDVLSPSMDVPEGTSRYQRDLEVVREFIELGMKEKSARRYIENAVRYITDKIGCDYAAVVTAEDGRFRFEAVYSKPNIRAAVAEPILKHAMSRGKPLLIADAAGDARFAHHPSVQEMDVHSVICVPMFVRNEPIGCLYLGYEGLNGVFTPEDLYLAEVFGAQLGLVLLYLDSYDKQTRTVYSVVKALTRALDLHDPLMMGHSERVGEYSKAVASFMKLPAREINDVYLAGLLHDIGRIAQNDDIVETQRAINRGEVKPIIEHVELGVKILSEIVGLERAVPMVETHHEHYDGTGLPKGLKGDEIPLGGRIICAANIFDEFLNPIVPERKPLSPREAMMKLKLEAGKKLDPEIVDTFQIAYRKGALLLRPEDAKR